jgi:asparagine synthase (glutamine-hydrolysing)
MCGIAGILHRDGGPVGEATVTRMLDRLIHRGPDDEGLYIADGVGLGHRRLSIIDVSAAGHQPMPNAAETIWITYNGELYNYKELRRTLEHSGRRFRSDSDTEVILQAYEEWGTDCLQQFNGMFAFAIWDARDKTLFCARDRIGIKPFYYADNGQRFAFASEIKALLTLPELDAEPDMAGLLDYLAFSFVRGERTMFRGIHKLLPGEMLVVSADGLQRITYWDVVFDESDRRPEAAISEELAWLIDDAVRIQMRADVPVGTHLSGGLDSSLVTTLARRHHPGTLLSFNGRFAEGSEYDESGFARIVAEASGVELIDVLVDAEGFASHLAHLTWHMDEPAAGPGLYPQFFVCQAAQRQVKVALGGQGGDEVFVGYPRYRDDLCRNQVVSLLRGQRGPRGYPLHRAIANVVRERGLRSVASLLLRGLDPLPAPSAVARILQQTAAAWDLNIPDQQIRDLQEAEFERAKPLQPSPLGRLLYHDLKHYLTALLHVEDRTSMAVSLESRVPLLDHRIVELMARVPSEVKFPPFRFKHLLRKVAAPILPQSIVERADKKGFPTPLTIWLERLRGDPALIDLLKGGSLRRQEITRRGPGQAAGFDGGLGWSTLSLELWSRIFLEQVPVEREVPPLQRAS